MLHPHEKLIELALDMSCFETLEHIVDYLEQSKPEKSLTQLQFDPQCVCLSLYFHHTCRHYYQTKPESFSLWKRFVQQVVRHDGADFLEPLINSSLSALELDYLLEQGLNLLSTSSQYRGTFISLCASREHFYPQLEHALKQEWLNLKTPLKEFDEQGNAGGALIQKSQHFAYIEAAFSNSNIHPDDCWVSICLTSNQKPYQPYYQKMYGLQALTEELTGKFIDQFKTQWPANWYVEQLKIVEFLLKKEANFSTTYAQDHYENTDYLPSVEHAVKEALYLVSQRFTEKESIPPKWHSSIQDFTTLSQLFYDHQVYNQLDSFQKKFKPSSHSKHQRL